MNIKIKEPSLEDVDSLTHIFCRYRQFYGCNDEYDVARAFLIRRISEGSARIFVVIGERDDIKGFAQVYPSFSSLSLRGIWILNDLYVDVDCRSKGVGKTLLDHIHSKAREESVGIIKLETRVDNAVALSLYKKMGYCEDREFVSLTAVDF